MFVIRPSTPGDLESIFDIAKHLNTVNLPADKDVLKSILGKSDDAFSGTAPLFEREYFFVLEDMSNNELAGTSMIHAQHGTRSEPHVYLRVVRDEHYSDTLDKYMVHQCLQMGYNFNGPTEIGGLILRPKYRGHPTKLGKLLSYVRFLYIAMYRASFRDRVLSELLPPLEKDGTSKLWKHFGKRFTEISYLEADRLSKHNKEFIKSLFPNGLIYTSLFPQDVQDEIGVVGESTKGVEAMLKKIGFSYARRIDPFDGGPHFTAMTDDISLVKNASQKSLTIAAPGPSASWTIVASQDPFRATACLAETKDDHLVIDQPTAQSLNLREAAACWSVNLS